MAIADNRAAPSEKTASFELDDLLSLRDIFAVLQRHYKLIILCAVAGLMLGLAYIIFTPPRYSASTSIFLDPRPEKGIPDVLAEGRAFQDTLIIDTQLEVIRSRKLMEKVAKKAGILEMTPVAQKGFLSRVKEIVVGTPPAATEKELPDIVRQGRISGLMGGLNVARVRNTFVIAINYTSGNPQHAAKMANLIAEVYLDDELESQYEASQRANDWLKIRLGVLRKELADAEKAVEVYKERNNIVQTDGRGVLSDQQLSDLNARLISARAATTEAKARLDNILVIIESGNPDAATNDILSNSVISDLRGKYLELSRHATEILRRQGKEHMAYKNLQRQMQDLQNFIFNEYRRMSASYKSEYEFAKSKEQNLEAELDAAAGTSRVTNINQIELRELQRRADSTRALYTKMLDKSNQEVERQSLPTVKARIINPAIAPGSASWPNKRNVVMISLLLGVIVGLGLAFLREQFEKFLWKSEDLEAATQRTCLGMLPKIAFDREKIGHMTKRWSTKEIDTTNASAREFNKTGFGEVTTLLDKQTGITTEIMRNVQLAVQVNKDQLRRDNKAKVISFVSARPGEGKSITSCFLAKHLAKTGYRVALIDCDFRRPSLTHWFLPAAPTGFYELASRIGKDDSKDILMDISKICYKTGQDNLHFIPAKGSNNSIGNLNLVSSGQMHALIEYMQQIFDVILIDLPPIMNIVDARMISHSIDHFILLAHWGKTDREVVHKALTRAPEVYAKTVGAMLTLVDTEKASRYGYYNYNYYYYYHHQPS